MIAGTRAAWTGSLFLLLFMGGCAPISLKSLVREDPTLPGRYVKVGPDKAAVTARVFRQGQPVAVRPWMALLPGDEIETGPQGAAIIAFKRTGTVTLAPHTRVRVGSLEVLFGRIFAKIRGLFTVESQEVVAATEGTEFMLELLRGTVRVIAVKDVVTCRSKSGKWPGIRLVEGNEVSVTPKVGPPAVKVASHSETKGLRAWASAVATAPPPPPPPPVPIAGFCCENGQVRQAIESECGGDFRQGEEQARQACAVGFCCAGGSVTKAIRSQCKSSDGQFFPDSESAQEACKPTPKGWCCAGGAVTQMTASQCGASEGHFFPDINSAQKVCAQADMVYCCYLPATEGQGTVKYESRAACLGKKGKPFTDQTKAKYECIRVN